MAIGRTEGRDTPRDPVMLQHRKGVRNPLRDVAVVVVDESPSQAIGNRRQATEAAVSALTERLGRERDLDVRVIRTGKPQPGSGDDGTKLFTAVGRTMSDIPKQRLAATIM